jgi:NADH-quinone oxidoreductase subunit N
MNILFRPIIPHIIVALCGCIVLLIRAYGKKTSADSSAWVSIFGLIIALSICVMQPGRKPISAFSGMVSYDPVSTILCLLVILSGILAVLLSMDYINRIGIAQSEFYALLMFAVSGMMFLGSASDLVSIFLGVELMSISIYVMVGFNRSRLESGEAAIKYLILGAFASGFLLYGIAMIYGATGYTGLREVAEVVRQKGATQMGPIFLVGIGLLIIGLGFKIGAVPFHMWVPDVYQGAPTSVTAFMATAVKAAGIAVIVRIFYFFLSDFMAYWIPVISFLAVITMTVGNLAALTQNNMKRMLAYSSIAHAGYILVGLVATMDKASAGPAISSIFFYLLAYTVMNMGAFGVIILLGKDKDEHESIEAFRGLSQRRPWAAFLLALFLLALAGIPPTVGFAGKFFIFATAMRAGLTGLVIIGVLNSALSAYYYLRPLIIMYMSEPEQETEEIVVKRRPALAIGLTISAVLTVELGLHFVSWLSGGANYFEAIQKYLSAMI